jgi:death on curing protein
MNKGGYWMSLQNSESIRYLTPSDLYNINNEVMGGDTYVRDLHLLNSAAARPAIRLFGQEQFPTLVDKAAALLHSLAYHHLFVDGNKRTAVRAVALFLDLNGYILTWNYTSEYPFILEVAQGRHDVSDIALWLAQFIHSAAQAL